jgi:glycosyltransferase involved in cell wall biosynthesis
MLNYKYTWINNNFNKFGQPKIQQFQICQSLGPLIEKKMKISIITPAFNAGNYLQEAIDSVLIQDYEDIEHIIVDGGSSDNTLDILKKNTHLKWISEKDNGQADAMNKGFRMSTGDIIGYLNADDYYYHGAFNAIIPYFLEGHNFVVGKIKVHMPGGTYWINDPRTDFDKMIRHWEHQAFSVNPVGYFYRREVQDAAGGFNPDNHFAMDLEFLLNCAKKYKFTKIEEDILLGVFRYDEQCKTYEQSLNNLSLWTAGNFSFIDQLIHDKPPDYVSRFYKDRDKGYKMRRNMQEIEIINEKIKGHSLNSISEMRLRMKKYLLYLNHCIISK